MPARKAPAKAGVPSKVSRQSGLSARAATVGWRLEQGDDGYRLVDAQTGTFVAAKWSNLDGYGLTLDEVEAALRSL